VFQKELYNVIPNCCVWRVLLKRIHLKAYNFTIPLLFIVTTTTTTTTTTAAAAAAAAISIATTINTPVSG
jgi:hypothetical protein